jgi:hypothetical protein
MTRHRFLRRALRFSGITLAAVAATAGGVAFWYRHRPQPPPEERALFRGVAYRRWSTRAPRPLVLHLLTIDLKEPGVRFLVTPPTNPEADLPLVGKKTTRFLAENGLRVAVNADFFYPWRSNAPWDYYPHVGEPVRTEGDAASRGVWYCRRQRGGAQPSPPETKLSTLWLTADNRAVVSEHAPATVYDAVGGHELYTRPSDPPRPDYSHGPPQPSLAAGVDREGRRLFLLLVDGRQPGYSEGVTPRELGELMRSLGAWQAIQLDGGGSATMVTAGADGRPRILNSPIDSHIPGRERPVANHLGVYALPL